MAEVSTSDSLFASTVCYLFIFLIVVVVVDDVAVVVVVSPPSWLERTKNTLELSYGPR